MSEHDELSARTVSFDLFDTLLVRPFLRPEDLFTVVEQELARPGWARARQEAERAARTQAPNGETNLDEIYRELDRLGHVDHRSQARAAELAWESRTRLVPEIVAKVAAARAAGARILFISDMYLPRAVIEPLLHDVLQPGDVLYLSHEERCGKGSGLWKRLVELYPKPWTHFGDNPWADGICPAICGIQTVPVTAYHPNSRELDLDRDNPGRPIVAGMSRLARALRPPGMDAAWLDGANVVGPVVYRFTRWVLENTKARQVPAVYFLSRDGELPHAIARRIAEVEPNTPACHYLHGSRHAFYNAAFELHNEKHHERMVQCSEKSILGVLTNLKIPPGQIHGWLLANGYLEETWNAPLSLDARREFLGKFAHSPDGAHWYESHRAAHFVPTIAYLEQLGVFSYPAISFVDLGWSASTFDSFREIIARSGRKEPAPIGLFFGLHRNAGPDRLTFEFGPSLTAHWAQAYAGVLEMMVPGTHGQVLGYKMTGQEKSMPEFAKPTSAPLEVITALHAGAMAYVNLALEHHVKTLFNKRMLRNFLVCPTYAESVRWTRFGLGIMQCDDVHKQTPLVSKMSLAETISLWIKPGRSLSRPPWPNASFVLTWKAIPRAFLRLLTLKYRVERIALNLYESMRLNKSR